MRMAEVYKVARPFERYDEKLRGPRKYRRGEIISMKEAARISSLSVLLDSGSIYRLPEELAKETLKQPEVQFKEAQQEVAADGRSDT
jgi:hypothetical protein